jgi:hypothetical protein
MIDVTLPCIPMFAKKRPIEDEYDENDYDSPNAWEPYYAPSYMP